MSVGFLKPRASHAVQRSSLTPRSAKDFWTSSTLAPLALGAGDGEREGPAELDADDIVDVGVGGGDGNSHKQATVQLLPPSGSILRNCDV
jgi:hypothetical protein